MSSKRRKLIGTLALVFLLNIALISLAQYAQAVTYRQGSTGEQVRIIQSKLKNWGYYDGTVDGIFGSRTAEAVKYFQRKNGLTADGIVGPATLRALGMSTGGGSGSSSQSASLDLLARVISAEARGEPYSGQVAVGAVILNRVEHPSRWRSRRYGRPRRLSTAPTPAAGPSTILTPTPPPAPGSGAGR